MAPLDFLRLVLPTAGHGYYCACELTTPYKYHEYSTDLAALFAPITEWADQRRDVYFALSTFEEGGLRTADNARFIKALFIDMDGYDSPKDADDALGKSLPLLGIDHLGEPTKVISGGGLHVYWPFTHEVDIETWKPIANNFKRLCVQEGLRIDMSVTADAARVLRVPGTYNFKPKYPTPRKVKVRSVGGTFDHEALGAAILAKLKTPGWEPPASAKVLVLPGMRPQGAGNVKLFENTATRFKTIMLRSSTGDGCGQLAHYINHAQEDGMEPLWRGLLSIAQKCDDGWKAAVKLSQLHPYDGQRLAAKWGELKGPYSCRSFDEINPGVCGSCQHWSKITNPLALGRETLTTTEAKEIVIEAPQDDAATPAPETRFTRPEAPFPFSYGQNSGMYVEIIDEKGKPNNIHFMDYVLFPVGVLVSRGTHSMRFLVQHPQGVREIMLPAKAIASKDETTKLLSEQNIFATTAGNSKYLHQYIAVCAGKAAMEMRALAVPDHFGWQSDGSFVLGGKVYRKGCEPTPVPMHGLENIVNATLPSGTLEAWREFMHMLIAAEHYQVLAVILAGAATPLMEFTGLHGLTVHCGSSASGTGKSVALSAAASVWGHPTGYRTPKGTSMVAMQQRLGLLRSLPVITDEVTVNSRTTPDWVPAWLLDMTEGKGKERMESNANKERLNLSTWRTMALMSSNTHWTDMLTSREHASEGELRRLLEIKMDDKLAFTESERVLLRSINENYGVAGDAWVRRLVNQDRDELKAKVLTCYERMMHELHATDDERYWLGGIACMLATGIEWAEAGIVTLPMVQILDVYRQAVRDMRVALDEGNRTADDVLSAFLQENYGQMIVMRKADNVVVAQFGGAEIDVSLTRTHVKGRVELQHEGETVFVLPVNILKQFCVSMSFSFSMLKTQLMAKHVVEIAKRDLGRGTKVPEIRVNALVVRVRKGDERGLLSGTPAVGTS